MGKKFNNKKRKRNGEASKVEKPKRERSDQSGYVEMKKESKDFETFYKLQEIVPEEEFDDFIKTLQSSLPASFRITGNKSEAKALCKILEEEFFKPLSVVTPEMRMTTKTDENGVSIEEEPIKPLEPKALTWYPTGMAYQLNLSRKDIRRCEPYWRLHQCLITETATGSISRQEAVSMIPPLLMDIQPHHKVLDMCAAPGSKTAQLIEQLHSSDDYVKSSIPPGVVVANDSDNKRCYLLTHQAKRLQSPSIIITNHDAAFMPNILYTKKDGSTGKLKFDRILCDVPCSGDGTMRKNVDVWGKWNPVNGANLHGLQLRIARRGLEMLSVGGRMVYSTCSMSPMENESVIQRLLLEADGAVKLVDCTGALPGLKYRSGLTKWKVVSRDMQIINTPEDIPPKLTNVYHKHLFPVERDDLHLERCLRPLPHHQDTGGFFVAVMEKVSYLPGEKAEAEGQKSNATMHTQRTKQPPRKRRRQGFKEEPYYYLSDSIAKLKTDDKDANKVSQIKTENKSEVKTENGSETKNENDSETKTENESETKTENESEVKTENESETKTENDSETKTENESETKTENESETKTENGSETKTENGSETKTENESETKTENGSKTETPENSAESAPMENEKKSALEDLRIWESISSFFGLKKEIPEASCSNFMTRSKEGRTKNIYISNALVKDIIDRNQDRMKIINTGVKILMRTDNKGAACDFRLAQEGIQSIIPLISKRKITVARSDMITLLTNEDTELPPEIALMAKATQDQCKNLVTGSVLLEYIGDPTVAQNLQHTVPKEQKIQIEMVGWKGRNSMRGYVAKPDRVHYLRLIRADTSKYLKNKFIAAAERQKGYNCDTVGDVKETVNKVEVKSEDEEKMETS